jgi:putative transposase
MVEPHHPGIPVSVQASLLGINRTSLYYKPHPLDRNDLAIKETIDRLYTKHPEFGYRRITKWLQKYEGMSINHKSILRHMREMGIQAIYPRPNTSKPHPTNPVYPYLLSGLAITRPNQVWSIDITYIPIRKSWLYLVAILDWYSRCVIDWQIDDTLEIGFVLSACESALKKASPVIMNSDQGSHFTSPKYTELFINAGSKISMDHRGRAYDNIFIERLWRTVKYEDVYPHQYDTPKDARKGIKLYLDYYNNERLHQSLGYMTPMEVYLADKGLIFPGLDN